MPLFAVAMVVYFFGDREDLSSDEVEYFLRVLEAHELLVQNGNRWRIPESVD
jgi:hypothetical protein